MTKFILSIKNCEKICRTKVSYYFSHYVVPLLYTKVLQILEYYLI